MFARVGRRILTEVMIDSDSELNRASWSDHEDDVVDPLFSRLQ